MPITELNVMFLNLWAHKTYGKNQRLIHSYINELLDFSEYYLKTRYSMTVKASVYWPYYVPKTYDDVKALDRITGIHKAFGHNLQMYCGYGLVLKPYGGETTAGICECVGYMTTSDHKGIRKPEPDDMMYADMPAYDANSLFGKSIYWQMSQFSRVFFHELDHQVLWLQNDRRWLIGVHKAAKLPLEVYNKSNPNLGKPLTWAKKAPGFENVTAGRPYFTVQQDPRKV